MQLIPLPKPSPGGEGGPQGRVWCSRDSGIVPIFTPHQSKIKDFCQHFLEEKPLRLRRYKQQFIIQHLFGQTKTPSFPMAYFILQGNQTARSTLLERRHLVQAYTWHGVPLTTALTRLTLGFQVRLERLWEWETLIPKVTPLPQKSHFAIRCTSHPNHNPRNDAIRRRLDMIADIGGKCKHYF